MKQFDIWFTDLNPPSCTETGKVRLVVILQTNLFNKDGHPSTLICLVKTNLKDKSFPLLVRLFHDLTFVLQDSDIIKDQVY